MRAAALGVLVALPLAACVSDPAPARPTGGIWHVVRAGETVYGIGREYSATTEAVVRVNRIGNVRGLQIGTRLWIPGGRRPTESPEVADAAITPAPPKFTGPRRNALIRAAASMRARATGWLAKATGFGRGIERSLMSVAMGERWSVSPRPATRPVRSLLEIRHENVVVQEFDLSCGAAALATLFNFQHGDPVAEREIATALMGRQDYIDNPLVVRLRHGFSLLDLKRYAERRGYRGRGYGGLDLDALVERAPVMVPVNHLGYSHFVVFRGVRGDRVLLADPAWGNRTMRIERFEEAWIAYPKVGKVAFAVERRDGAPPPDQLALRRREIVM